MHTHTYTYTYTPIQIELDDICDMTPAIDSSEQDLHIVCIHTHTYTHMQKCAECMHLYTFTHIHAWIWIYIIYTPTLLTPPYIWIYIIYILTWIYIIIWFHIHIIYIHIPLYSHHQYIYGGVGRVGVDGWRVSWRIQDLHDTYMYVCIYIYRWTYEHKYVYTQYWRCEQSGVMIHICIYVCIYTHVNMNIDMCIHNIGGVSRVGVDGGGCSWCIRRM